jgi:uncharacterized protein YeaO (DUF488 family)
MLEVWTARISTRDPDRFDVTRKSGTKAFAPSWRLLNHILEIRNHEDREETEAEWKTYAAAYLREMARSRRENPGAWEALLGRERVVLCCYCTRADRCHRRILARILASLGAVDRGELL